MNFKRLHRILSKSLGMIKEGGIFIFLRFLFYRLSGNKNYRYPEDLRRKRYRKWIKRNEKGRQPAIVTLERLPKISVITPVYNVDQKWLDKCIRSVVNQSYQNWEFCLYDDSSTNPETIKELERWKDKDQRIKVKFGKENLHISGASNKALEMATGDWIVLLDNDDEISSDALFEVAKAINSNPGVGFIYSDEDKIDEKGARSNPFFKPEWDEDLFLSMMYTSHLGAYRADLINKIKGFRKGFEGAQDYDLVLRLIEIISPNEIYHIPKILYHWRTLKTSTASGHSSKLYAETVAKKALADYLKRNKIEGTVLDGLAAGAYRVKRKILNNPKVAIIIPFKDQVEYLEKCLSSIKEKTDYKNYEVILVNNQSKEKRTEKFLKNINDKKIKVFNYDKEFNFSAINNFAVKKTEAEMVLFLNNDIEVISPEWLSSMVELGQREEVGAVGAKLLFENGRVQHAGVIMGLGVAGHAFKYFKDEDYGYFSFACVIRGYSAVTGACMLVRKDVFEGVGGFDENNLSIAYNDVDLCLKLKEKGFRNLYTPYAKLYHFESISRGSDLPEKYEISDPKKYKRIISEINYMKNKWKEYIENDPFYSPNLTKKYEDFRIGER